MSTQAEVDFNQTPQSHNGSLCGYTVEARQTYGDPLQVGEQIFDCRWRKVKFDRAAVGVPSHASHDWQLPMFNLLSYPAAQALRWWLHAAATSESYSAGCLESRLVVHKIEYRMSATPTGTTQLIGGEDRSNIMPDWGSNSVATQAKEQ